MATVPGISKPDSSSRMKKDRLGDPFFLSEQSQIVTTPNSNAADSITRLMLQAHSTV